MAALATLQTGMVDSVKFFGCGEKLPKFVFKITWEVLENQLGVEFILGEAGGHEPVDAVDTVDTGVPVKMPKRRCPL